MREFRLGVILALALAGSASAQDGLVGRTVAVKLPPAEIEPGKIDAASTVSAAAISALAQRPDRDSSAIIKAQGEDLDAIAPPMLMVRALRTTDPDEANYLYWLGLWRMAYDAAQCADQSAGPYAMQLTQLIVQTPQMKQIGNHPEAALRAVSRLQSDGRVYTSRVSAWYLCSQGAAMYSRALSSDQRVSLAEWKASDQAITAAKADLPRSMARTRGMLEQGIAASKR